MKLNISGFQIDSVLDERAFSRWRKFVEDYFADGHKRDTATLSLDMFGDAGMSGSALIMFAFIEISRCHPVNLVINLLLEEGWLCREECNGVVLFYKSKVSE